MTLIQQQYQLVQQRFMQMAEECAVKNPTCTVSDIINYIICYMPAEEWPAILATIANIAPQRAATWARRLRCAKK